MQQQWQEIQRKLREKCSLVDDFPPLNLSIVAGADISFIPNNLVEAVVCIVILQYPSLNLLHSFQKLVTLSQPYIPGFLAFREAPLVIEVLEDIKTHSPHFYPQLLLVDGNGLIHPQKFGLACHIGVTLDIPTIGIAKSFLEIRDEDLLIDSIKSRCKKEIFGIGSMDIVGKSGFVYGAAVIPVKDVINPIFVSIGHRVSLQTAVKLVMEMCKYRVPEPIRLADQFSRSKIRELQGIS